MAHSIELQYANEIILFKIVIYMGALDSFCVYTRVGTQLRMTIWGALRAQITNKFERDQHII